MATPDVDQKRKLEAALILKATEVVDHMRRIGEAGAAEQVEKLAEALERMLKSKEFPSAHAGQFREVSKMVQRSAFQLSVDNLLGAAEEKARGGDDKGRNDVLTKAKDHFSKALRYGADVEFRGAVERRVQTVLMTSKEGVDERTKQAAKRKLELENASAKAHKGVERRRARRYGDPSLDVTIDGLRYATINWSTRGLRMEPFRPEAGFYAGMKVKMELKCAGVGGGGRQLGRVVRVDEGESVSVDFGEISTVILDLMHHMREEGIQPEMER